MHCQLSAWQFEKFNLGDSLRFSWLVRGRKAPWLARASSISAKRAHRIPAPALPSCRHLCDGEHAPTGMDLRADSDQCVLTCWRGRTMPRPYRSSASPKAQDAARPIVVNNAPHSTGFGTKNGLSGKFPERRLFGPDPQPHGGCHCSNNLQRIEPQ